MRRLLTMTSGSIHVWFADQRIESGDLLREFVTAPLTHAPGVHFAYTGSGPYVAGRVLERATGLDVRTYLMPRLFEPLDLHNPAWHACPLGFPFAESDLFLRTSELARFARLLLQEGEWDGGQLIPGEYVRRMSSELVVTGGPSGSPSAHGYGLGVWNCGRGDAYRMDGRYGQFAIVIPELCAAVTVTAHNEDETLLDAVFDLVVAQLR